MHPSLGYPPTSSATGLQQKPALHHREITLTGKKGQRIHDIWKRDSDTAARCIAEEKEYSKQRWDKSHLGPDFKEGDQVLVSTLNFKNLKGHKKMRDSFVGHFTITNLSGKNAVEVKLTEELKTQYSQ
ncbi:hypothetical protein O181_016574 [Austropuccinia psidii MF-1]|uniref:Uncharacterized protein n=1 Tax=Austropuccinia psidii MF-1 TaxID=1389203 RepID=A0A9Q3GRY5_9BASI|nr:hypothetical protein [Austropuccinia psidii MF-1]